MGLVQGNARRGPLPIPHEAARGVEGVHLLAHEVAAAPGLRGTPLHGAHG